MEIAAQTSNLSCSETELYVDVTQKALMIGTATLKNLF